MKHPSEAQLALYSGGDLSVWQRWLVGAHVRVCGDCRCTCELLLADRGWLRQASDELPPEVHWDRMAREMIANIHVGLAAGECVDPVAVKPRRLHWRPVLAVAAMMALLVGAWWLNTPASQTQELGRAMRAPLTAASSSPAKAAGPMVEATPSGLEVSENGSAFTLMHPGTQPVAVTVNMGGSVRARYVDADTAQVTITNVYVQ